MMMLHQGKYWFVQAKSDHSQHLESHCSHYFVIKKQPQVSSHSKYMHIET
jgi:hypothetical protein